MLCSACPPNRRSGRRAAGCNGSSQFSILPLRSVFKGPPLGSLLARLGLAAAIAIAAGWGLEQVVPAWPALLRGGVTGGVAVALCLLAGKLLGVGEVDRLVGMVTRRLRRRR